MTLRIWIAATVLHFLGGWALQAIVAPDYWRHVGVGFVTLASYALVTFLLGRGAVREIQAMYEALRQAEKAEEERQVAHARLEGVQLTARETAHQINNAHTEVVGWLDLLQSRQDLPADGRAMILRALAGVDRATQYLTKLQHVVRVETKQTPVGPAIDVERSTGSRSTGNLAAQEPRYEFSRD
ncbi:MAG: hypothetical protein HYY04_17520 [Chloroflexi bacterium]|nr:hypothetical protein [Chloroflexota bacterium]